MRGYNTLTSNAGGRGWLGLILLAVFLSGCARHAFPVAQTVAPSPLTGATLHSGVVVGLRQVALANQPGAKPGVDAVLAALREPASGGTAAVQEIVILRDDGNPVSVAKQGGAGFAVGDKVTIAEGGASTALVRGN